MKSTDDRTDHARQPAVSWDEFDRFQDIFCTRMRSDQIRLTTLAAFLARIEGNPVGVFSALQSLAHRIRGAAVIFEASALSSSAYALEQAATHACGNGSDHTDGAVWSALEDLVERLAAECVGDFAREQTRNPPRHPARVADEFEFEHWNMGSRQTTHR
jgi:HPt (histidine-containing phosphotransfer) domain-containing protein